MKLTEHLDSVEFACHDGTPVPDDLLPSLKELCVNLETVRKELGGKPLLIVSGFRTGDYNRQVGGAKKSQHCLGTAADIACHPLKPADVHSAILRLIAQGFIRDGGVGVYDGWVHYDLGPKGRRWDNRVDGKRG